MIRITGLKLKPGHGQEDIINAVSEKLRLNPSDIEGYEIVKKSLDARDKENIRWNYIIDVSAENEASLLNKFKNSRNISKTQKTEYALPEQGTERANSRPYIIGSGPCGLFCTYFLAKEGYKPVLIERGQSVCDRINTVDIFKREQRLDPESNILFGEGGAGTFSDGKLNTGVNDRQGRGRLVLETLVENGAPEEILYLNKPHIGTDLLTNIISNMRNRMEEWGAEILFNTKLADLYHKNNKIVSIALESKDQVLIRPCSILVLAAGHSARDTFYMLKDQGLAMRSKPFAVGLRAEHLQENINKAMYGDDFRQRYGDLLPPADYKLTYKAKDGRGVYSFCMCPGGYIINSSSEEGRLCINGMSYSKRDSFNANSAIVVTVSPEDFGSGSDPLKGLAFQQELEEAAYKEGMGAIPVQTLGDFNNKCISDTFTGVSPLCESPVKPADLNRILPDYICNDIKEAFEYFGNRIKGFDDPCTVLSAVESRTSSPVRILRDDHFESNIKGIFPGGEGAGYAGGITSSAIDGIKIFEEIYGRYSGRNF